MKRASGILKKEKDGVKGFLESVNSLEKLVDDIIITLRQDPDTVHFVLSQGGTGTHSYIVDISPLYSKIDMSSLATIWGPAKVSRVLKASRECWQEPMKSIFRIVPTQGSYWRPACPGPIKVKHFWRWQERPCLSASPYGDRLSCGSTKPSAKHQRQHGLAPETTWTWKSEDSSFISCPHPSCLQLNSDYSINFISDGHEKCHPGGAQPGLAAIWQFKCKWDLEGFVHCRE